jgi:hypothetical protein
MPLAVKDPTDLRAVDRLAKSCYNTRVEQRGVDVDCGRNFCQKNTLVDTRVIDILQQIVWNGSGLAL